MNSKTHKFVGSSLPHRILMSVAAVVLTLGASAQTHLTSFTPSSGRFRTSTVDNKIGSYQQQDAAEDWNVIYANSGKINLYRRTDAFRCYVRWYNYADGSALAGLEPRTADFRNGESADYDGFGLIKTGNNTVTGFAARYNYGGSDVVYVGCDQSAYRDYTANSAFVEPTLSQRIVYEIRPASEMATEVDKYVSTSGEWMEEYDLIAPTGRDLYIGPKYAMYEATNMYANYYYGESNPIQMTSGWKCNNTDLTTRNLSSGQFYKVSSNNTGDVTYTFTCTIDGKTYNIARYTVHYKLASAVGPANIRDTAYLTGTTVLKREDFNYETNIGTALRRYDVPLSFDQSNLGFYYTTTTAEHNAPNSAEHCPGYCEYSFVNDGSGWRTSGTSGKNANFANHVGAGTGTDASKGYALYADGSKKPGKVFDLKFVADLCPGAEMYFSAYVGEVGGTTRPILDFIVVGVYTENDVEKEKVLTTFTTGEFKDCTGGWRRILFPLKFNSQMDYPCYRLRVVNKANSNDGNDFFIDDIAIYLKPAPITPIQASSFNNCLEEGTSGAAVALYTRIDYEKVSKHLNTDGTSSIYYRWEEGDYHDGSTAPLTAADGVTYLNANAEGTYGEIKVPNSQSSVTNRYADKVINATTRTVDGETKQISGFQVFDETYNQVGTTPSANYAFIKELCTNDNGTPEERYVIYIVTPVTLTPGKAYTCRIAESTAVDAFESSNKCSNVTALKTAAGLHIHSEKGMVTGEVTETCAHYSFDLRVKIQYSKADYAAHSSTTAEAYYKAHWLFGTKTFIEDHEDIYGYSYSRIKQALDNMIGKASTAPYTEEDKAIINRLHQSGLLVLASDLETEVYTVMPLNREDELSYTAFPVEKLDAAAPDCFNPVQITLRFKNVGVPNAPRNAILFVKQEGEAIPTFVSSRPRRVRIIEGTLAQNVRIELTESTNHYSLGAITLYQTDDAAYKSAGSCISYNTADKDDVTGTGNSIDFSTLGDLKAGHSYTFKLLYALNNKNAEGVVEASCGYDATTRKPRDGEAYITFLVVPKLLTFTGVGVDAAWNDDNNWTYDNNGTAMIAFVPLEQTSVVFQRGDHVLAAPVSVPPATTSEERKKLVQEQPVESAALPYITFDINYQPYTCRRVFVPHSTTIVDQHYITSSDAWQFDMKLVPNQWNMTSMPVHGVVTGDMFIPAELEKGATNGDESTYAPFKVQHISQDNGYASDRLVYGMYNSMYNSEVYHYEANNTRINITSTDWSFATNSLNTPLDNAKAWSLGVDVEDASKTYVMRLPKDEDRYNYFRSSYWVGGYMHEDIDRADNYGRPIFTEAEKSFELSNHQAGNTFVFGNPTFACIDLVKFYDVNKGKIKNVFYLSGVNNGTRYQHNTAQVTGEEGSYTWTTTAASVKQFIAPMQGVMIEAAENAVKQVDGEYVLEVNVTKDMLVPSTGSRTSGRAGVMAAPTVKPELRIAALADNFVSYALIVEDDEAHTEALQGEDAEILLLDEAKTPFAIYTVASDKALAINRTMTDSETAIPLAMFAQRDITAEVVTFSGDDAFVTEWDLIDNTTGNRESLYDGFTTTLRMDNSGVVRYYLEHARHNAPSTATSLDDTYGVDFTAYAQDGVLTVYSAEDMHNFFIYDAAGRMVASANNAGRLQQHNLINGVYMVLANGQAKKVVVK